MDLLWRANQEKVTGMIERMFAKGNRCLSAALFDEACLYYSRCIFLMPQLPYATFNMGIARLQQGRTEEGLRRIGEAIKGKPDLSYRLGIEGLTEEVSHLLRERLDMDSSYAFSIQAVALEDIEDEIEREPRVVYSSELEYVLAEDEAQDYYRQGVDDLSEGRFDNAVEAFMKAIELDPAYDYAYNDLAAAYLFSEQWAEAIPWLEKAIRLKPDYLDAYNNLGMVNMNLGWYEAAIDAFQNAVVFQADHAQTYHHIAVCYGYLGNLGEAVVWNRKALEGDPDFRDAVQHLGWALMSQGEDGEAVVCFEKVIALDPDFVPAYGNLGSLHLGRGNYAEAVTFLTKAIKLQPDYAHAHLNLFVAHVRLENDEEAVFHFKQAISLNPHLARAQHYALFGARCMDAGDYAEAVIWLEEALALQPNYEVAKDRLTTAYQNLWISHFDAEDYDQAIDYARKTVALYPDAGEYHYDLGPIPFK